MPLYRLTRTTIEAVQWNGWDQCEAIFSLIGIPHPADHSHAGSPEDVRIIPARGRALVLWPGRWVVKSARGNIHVVSPQFFEEHTLPVSRETSAAASARIDAHYLDVAAAILSGMGRHELHSELSRMAMALRATTDAPSSAPGDTEDSGTASP